MKVSTAVSPWPQPGALADRAGALLDALGVDPDAASGADINARTPITAETLMTLRQHGADDVHQAIERAQRWFREWRLVPRPKRWRRVVREFDNGCANTKGSSVSSSRSRPENLTEGLGEVQELIDICDFAVGLSRQLYGLVIASERPGHRMMESWHPLGVCGVITAFNFPVAVWGWNAAIALVCGDTVVWKPSEKTVLCALSCQALLRQALAAFPELPQDVSSVVVGDSTTATLLIDDERVPLISATGSTRMGMAVAPRVAKRFGRTILELGGNNAAIVTPSANLDLAQRAIVFSAVGTAGQRCTTLRRLIVHESIRDALLARLEAAYQSLPIGNPLAEGVLVGPVIDSAAFEAMQGALAQARGEGAIVFGGERVSFPTAPDACYVRPAICTMPAQSTVVRRETFAPILYVLTYDELDRAIHLHNEFRRDRVEHFHH
jgi:aldehyde dehydrogenase (NAD+)